MPDIHHPLFSQESLLFNRQCESTDSPARNILITPPTLSYQVYHHSPNIPILSPHALRASVLLQLSPNLSLKESASTHFPLSSTSSCILMLSSAKNQHSGGKKMPASNSSSPTCPTVRISSMILSSIPAPSVSSTDAFT